MEKLERFHYLQDNVKALPHPKWVEKRHLTWARRMILVRLEMTEMEKNYLNTNNYKQTKRWKWAHAPAIKDSLSAYYSK